MIQFTVDVIRSLVRNLLLPLKAYWILQVHVAHCKQYDSALAIATSSIDTVITVWPKRFIDNNINIRVDIVNTSIRIATDHNTELWLECRKLQSCNWLGHNFCKHVSSWTTLARDFTGFHVFANKVVSYVDILARLWNIGIWIKVIDLWVSSNSKIATLLSSSRINDLSQTTSSVVPYNAIYSLSVDKVQRIVVLSLAHKSAR